MDDGTHLYPDDLPRSTIDRLDLRAVGFVTIDDGNGEPLEQKNLVVDGGYEALIDMMITDARVSTIVLAYNRAAPVVSDMRLVGTPLVVGAVGTSATAGFEPVRQTDSRGLLTGCRWSALLTPTGSGTYDTAGLLTSTGALIAATAFSARPYTTTPITVTWTIRLR
jgi:hypothetical protein